MIFLKHYKKYIFLSVALMFLFFAFSANAANIGGTENFNLEKDFDASGRSQTSAVLVQATSKIYFYIDKSWWDAQNPNQKNEVYNNLENLSKEFENKIYPALTSVFGKEWTPGVDNDSHIYVLFTPMHSNEGGYFRTTDEYLKLQLPDSNEHEILYLALDNISSPQLKVFLAHEFMHLITFNQKDKAFGTEDDTWLNEARADYSSTILGYDEKYDGSNLQQRVKNFAENPSDSLTEWTGTKYDYASASLFSHYLIDQYGINIFIDSLKSKYAGIDSINYALQKNKYKEDFAQIFTNWTIASFLNNCSFNEKYCYSNKDLKSFRLLPSINFLPVTGNVSLSVTNVTKSWSGNWLKFIGGNGDLKFDFSSSKELNFRIPYIVEDSAGSYNMKFLTLDKNQEGEINISKFGTDYKSLVILPSLQSQIYKTGDIEPTYSFTYKVTVAGSAPAEDQDLIKQLLDKIAFLKQEIARLTAEKNNSRGQICGQLNNNLSFGMSGNSDVKCLQQFLNVSPQSGYFGSLTKAAVIKFQKKYGILNTGYAGVLTRQKINQLLGG